MRSKLIATLLLVVMVLGVCGCAQSAHSTPAEDEETETVEESTTGIESTTDKTLPTEKAQEEAADPVEAPAPEEPLEPLPEKTEHTAEEQKFLEFYGLEQFPDNMTPEDYEELRMLMYASQDTAEYLETFNSPESEPYYEESFELPTRTHEEARAVITEIADNFKSGPYYSELEGLALEYLDVNLNTLRTNPESSPFLSSYMESYKNGGMSEERFYYMIESWIRTGGPYGDNIITVQ